MKVFVSYAREDKPLVDGVVRDLTDLRHDPYYDQNLLGGQKWWEELLDRISTSEVFMPCLFESYRESEACRREATYAADLGIPFLPVVGSEGQPAGTSYLRAITDANWVTWNAQERSSLARLASSLGSIGPVRPPTDPVERPPAPVDYRMIDLDEEVRGGQGMSRDRQLAIVSDLRRMQDRRDAPLARELLLRMRGRFDILADVRDDIDTVPPAGPSPRPHRSRTPRPHRSRTPRHSPPRHSPPRHSPPRHSPPRHWRPLSSPLRSLLRGRSSRRSRRRSPRTRPHSRHSRPSSPRRRSRPHPTPAPCRVARRCRHPHPAATAATPCRSSASCAGSSRS